MFKFFPGTTMGSFQNDLFNNSLESKLIQRLVGLAGNRKLRK